MKDMDIQGIIRGKPHRTTIPDKKQPCPLDKVNRQFARLRHRGSNRRHRCSDRWRNDGNRHRWQLLEPMTHQWLAPRRTCCGVVHCGAIGSSTMDDDFTYVATWKGFVHVAFVIDAHARKIVGWRVSTSAHAVAHRA